jgi:hypothetical protein
MPATGVNKGFVDGGFTGTGDKLEPAGIVHKGEFVIPQSQTNQWWPLLNQIQSGTITPKEVQVSHGGETHSVADTVQHAAHTTHYGTVGLETLAHGGSWMKSMSGLMEAFKATRVGEGIGQAFDFMSGTVTSPIKSLMQLSESGFMDPLEGLSQAQGINETAGNVAQVASTLTSTQPAAVAKSGGFFSNILSKISTGAESFMSNTLVGKGLSWLGKGGASGITWISEKMHHFFNTSFGKVLGPAISVITGVSDVWSVISDAKENIALGNYVNPADVGLEMVQKAAYPFANMALNLFNGAIPGLGSALSGVDAVLDIFGHSPVRWVSDHLLELLPDYAYVQLADAVITPDNSVGISKTQAESATDMSYLKPNAPADATNVQVQPPSSSTVRIQANDFVVEPNANDKIGGVLDNKSVDEMTNLLRQMVGLLSQRQEVTLSPSTANAIVQMGASNKSFRK